MKIINKTKSLLVILAIALCVFFFGSVKSSYAAASNFSAGAKLNISNVSGNLNNINLKIEFTSSVNLDGENNALLVGLAASDDSIISDAKFIAASANAGVYDADGRALYFDDAIEAIGTKVSADSAYTYTFESRDFKVVDGSKDIAKLVIVGQKGALIESEISVSEVKYSVKFGDENAVLYSYKALVNAPASTPEYLFDFEGHQAVTGWADADSNAFVSGETVALKDTVYALQGGEKVAHSWTDVPEVPATYTSFGTLAHQACSCGALRLGTDSTALVNQDDLKVSPVGHTCTFEATFDWSNALNPGDKPKVVYACTDPLCDNTHEMLPAEITISEKTEARVPATCVQEGNVTYVATCTYDGVDASDEKSYISPMVAHTPEHHNRVEGSLQNSGNIEYWTCSECKGYFKDEDCTQATTLEGVTIPKYTYEDPQVISVSELTPRGGHKNYYGSYVLSNNDRYTYTFDKPYKSTSLQFNILFNMITTDDSRIRFHNYFCQDNEWDTTWACWFVTNGGFAGLSMDEYTWFDVTYTVGMHKAVMDTRAIMCGDTFTGQYQVDVYFDDVLMKTLILSLDPNEMTGDLFINSSKNNNIIYDIDYTGDVFDETQTVNVYDFNTIGKLSHVEKETDYLYESDLEEYSRILKFNLSLDPDASKTEFVASLGGGNCCRLWLQENNNNTFFFGWTLDGHPTDKYYLPGKVGLDPYVNYEFELGRIRITEGINAGLDFVYLKIDGEYLYNDPAKLYGPSWFYCDPKAEKGTPITENKVSFKSIGFEVEDLNYKEPEFEEVIDTISVNDLCALNGVYQNGSIDLMDTRNYTYYGKSQYGSVVFKGVFNFQADAYNNGDKNGTQFHFNNTWTPEKIGGTIWFNGGSGILIRAPKAQNGYIFGSNIPTGEDCNVEIGRLAIMDEGTFTGKHYFYAKVNGVLACEWIIDGTPEEVYTQKEIMITGKPAIDTEIGNTGNIIKNVAINKTVTLKVGDHTENVTVLQSGLVVIPEFSTAIVPSDKRITGWIIDGTETAFNPLADHVFEDITIVATIGDFMWKITFGTEEMFVGNGLTITVPETIPTKGFETDVHFVFDCWIDEDGNPFVEGTTATADTVYTAKFNSVNHTYNEWTVTTEPQCEAAGVKEKTCECGSKITEQIQALGHDYSVPVANSAVDATCTTAGKEVDMKCSRCESVQTGATIPAHHTLEHVDAQQGNCTELGNIEHYTCTVCHKNFSDINGMNELEDVTSPIHHELSKVEAQDPTCTADGNIEYYACAVCHENFDANGNKLDDVAIPAHHTLQHVDAQQGTCETEGNIEHYTCTVCHKNFSDEEGTNELENVSTPFVHDLREVKANPATCEEDGNIGYFTCRECHEYFDADGNVIDKQSVNISALGHDLVNDPEVPATYEADGKKAGKHCSRCDYTEGGEVIPKLENKEEPADPKPQRKGCKSVVAISGIVFVAAIAAIAFKKKRENI